MEADGHRGAEDRQPVLEDDDALLVEEHQRPLDGGVNVFGFGAQHQVAFDGFVQFLEVELQQEVGAGGGVRRESWRAAYRGPERPGAGVCPPAR